MKRMILSAVAALGLASPAAAEPKPWSHLDFQEEADEFRFAIVPDRGGGDYRGAFTNALRVADMMHPAFVMTVGDLINGLAKEGELRRQQTELTNFVSRVRAPFFYVVGNHDITRSRPADPTAHEMSSKVWKDYHGDSTYYSFLHKGCLFLVLDTMEGRDSRKPQVGITREQYAWARKTLAEHSDARWTFVFMHQPAVWGSSEWEQFERDSLLSRKYTVFAGDWHSYFHVRRYGHDYYILSVAGGVSNYGYEHKLARDRLAGERYGEFDHITWVTVTKKGPEVVNLRLDGVLPGNFLNRGNSLDDNHLKSLDRDLPETSEDQASAGWRNVDAKRNAPPKIRKTLWSADLSRWPEGFSVCYGDGATGSVACVRTPFGPGLRVVKANERGWIAITAKDAVPFAKDAKLQGYASVSGEGNDPACSLGFLRIAKKGGHFNYYSALDERSSGGGPRVHHLLNTAPGMRYDKLCRYDMAEAKGAGVTPAIVVAGAKSDSTWTDWCVEDLPTARRRWEDFVRSVPSRDHSADRMEAADYDRMLAGDLEHSAKVANVGGRTALLVDGREVPPVFFKGWSHFGNDRTKNVYCGKKMAQQGVNVQLVSVRLGASPSSVGWWTRGGFDAKGAANDVRDAMRMAPDAIFILAVNVSAYPEFTLDHPAERGVQANGEPIVGDYIFAKESWRLEPGKKRWIWPSISSRVLADEVAARLRELAAELRRTGLSKRIVGVQVCGYNDGQLSTPVPDFSPCALESFRRWQRGKYGEIRWNAAPAYDPKQKFFTPGADDDRIAYHHFLKTEPTRFIERAAKTFKEAMGKDLIVVRWCMSPFKGQFNDALDITAFAESEVIDVLAPQPAYDHRIPGLPNGVALPMASFHRRGKLLVNEFDLRTYAAVHPGDASELRAWWLSKSMDFPMWCSTYRKLAGQQIANGMGWWFFDMGGGWYEPDEIAGDIGASVNTYRAIVAMGGGGSRRPTDTAFVVDEEGLYLVNTFSMKYDLADTTPMRGPLEALAACSLPYDMYLAKDLIERPELAARYRTLVFYGMLAIDAPRKRMLDALKSGGRTLVFLSRTGAAGGAEATGFTVRRAHDKFEDIVAEPGVTDEMQSMMYIGLRARYLDPKRQPPKGSWCPDRWEIAESPELTVKARYADDRTVAIAERRGGNWKGVYVASVGALNPGYLNRLVREGGGYAPIARDGVTVDMGEHFLSLHCTKPGHYDFRLPSPNCRVTNLKTGAGVVTPRGVLPLDLTAGETRWYSLK